MSDPVGVAKGERPRKMRRHMGMKRLISAAHAAGYAMAPEEIAEARPLPLRAQSTALVVHNPVQRGVVANAQRSMRRMWLQWFATHGYNHRAAA